MKDIHVPDILDREGDVPRPPAVFGRAYPLLLTAAGPGACHAAHEFFHALISNPHTRRAYGRAVVQFLTWCEREGLELTRITPGLAGQYFHAIPGSAATQNLALSALRHFFDALVTRHAVLLNPFHSVRGIKHRLTHGKTPEITIPQARRLIASLDTTVPVGLRDRALLGTLITTGTRVGALSQLRVGDLQPQDGYRVLRFREKGGKERDVPVRSDLDEWLTEYMAAAGIGPDPRDAPLWRAGVNQTGALRTSGLTTDGIRHLVKRRLAAAGLPVHPHAPLVPGHGGHGPARPERADRGGPIPGRALAPVDHAAVRPAPAARRPQRGRPDLVLSPDPERAPGPVPFAQAPLDARRRCG